MALLSSRMRARVTSFAVACAVWLSASSVPLQTEARPVPASHELVHFNDMHNENVVFNQLSDGSVIAVRGLSASGAHFHRVSSPMDLYQELMPGRQAPSSLSEGNANLLRLRGGVGSRPRVLGRYKSAEASVPRSRSQLRFFDQQWFRNYYCYPPGASYSVCYAPAWSWAYLNSWGDSYGHAVVYAINAPLNFYVDGYTWRIPAGRGLEVWVYGFLFDFEASVSDAQYFDFESDVQYTF